MKNLLATLISFLFIHGAFAQVVFCPNGAKWNFLYRNGADAFPFEKNESVKYDHDSLIGGVTTKVLNHSRFYLSNTEACNLTLLKQTGDTIFFRNKFTQHIWQILYNFNPTIGLGWTNTLTVSSSTNVGVFNFKTVVDSIDNFLTNSTNLKRLHISMYVFLNNAFRFVDKLVVTERFGCQPFLFYWTVPNGLFQKDRFSQILCYQDNSWPLQQMSSKPCNYQNFLGLNSATEIQNIKVFPNPSFDELNLEIPESNQNVSNEINVLDVYGRIIIHKSVANKEKVQMNHLNKGIYFLELYKDKVLVQTVKLIKN